MKRLVLSVLVLMMLLVPSAISHADSGSSGSNSFYHWAYGYDNGEHWTTHRILQSSAWARVRVSGYPQSFKWAYNGATARAAIKMNGKDFLNNLLLYR